MDNEFSYPKNKIKVLLCENIHKAAVERLGENGYNVEEFTRSPSHDELSELIEDVHILGIRSKTKVTAEHIARAKKLLVIGCFGVGTNQVDLAAAAKAGIPVFNAPYSNTRSVAELAVADIFMLSRRAGYVNNMLHQGKWRKSPKGAYEVRGKTLGLVGYGHIGQQVGLLAESVGMNVVFFDLVKRLPLGTARSATSFDNLLGQADFLSLHVPALKSGKPLIGAAEMAKMRKGAYLLNLSRGSLVDLSALKEALESGQIGGAAFDVYPQEPKSNEADFECELTGISDKIVMTPHIGGSTQEAQLNIGLEVAESYIQYIDGGASMGAVNFPQVSLPEFPDSHRILNVHQNIPGALSEMNKIVSEVGANINAQYLGTNDTIGYLVMDIDKAISDEVKHRIAKLPASIKTRILF